LPAPAQGAVGIETLGDNAPMLAALRAISHADTYDCVMAERALLAGLGGTCHSPIAALACIDGDQTHLRAEILAMDGSEHVSGEARFARDALVEPAALAAALLGRASPALRSLFTR